MDRRGLLVASAIALCAGAAAAAVRLPAVEGASIGSDATGQYLAAWSAGWDWLPRPPNPEAGHGLWIGAWPLVHLARSLEGLYRVRFLAGALVASLAALAAWAAADRPREKAAAAAAAGAVAALDPGLVDTLVVAFRGYGAPEALAAATLCISMRPSVASFAAAGLFVAFAADQHPLAAGAAIGLLATLPALERRRWTAVALAIAFFLPRAWTTWKAAGCGAGWWSCLAAIATGSAEPEVRAGAMLARALHDRFAVETDMLWPGLAVGLALCALPARGRPASGPRIAAWAVGAAAGIVLVGLLFHTLRPYHLRMAAAPLAVAASVGLSRLWPLPLAWVAIVGITSWPVPAASPHPGGARLADRVAADLASLPPPLRVDGAWYGTPAGLDPAAVVLAALLQGQDPDRFSLDAGARVVLVVNGGATYVRLFADLGDARAWVAAQPAPPDRVGGAWDWMKAVHPHEADLGAASWPVSDHDN